VALCLYARDNGGPAIAHQSVYYPFTDTSLTSPDWDSGLMPGVDRKAGQLMVQLYGGDEAHNPLVNVLGADLRGLPPATVITCGHDVLQTDGLRLVEALRCRGRDLAHPLRRHAARLLDVLPSHQSRGSVHGRDGPRGRPAPGGGAGPLDGFEHLLEPGEVGRHGLRVALEVLVAHTGEPA
jgi:hypothetical protein